MNKTKKPLRIALVGGGSGGPTAPLLAVAEAVRMKRPEAVFLFIGTKLGPERRMAERERIPFIAVSAGKWRRYWSLHNAVTPFLIIIGFFQALVFLRKFRPAAILGAGGFVQVPVLWAAWVLRIPVMIHQQDIMPSLANSLCAPIARRISVAFAGSLQDFSQGLGLYHEARASKVSWTGNPCRFRIAAGSKDTAIKLFKLEPDLSTLLVLGGGTGAAAINTLILQALPQLTKRLQIIHVTGPGKKGKTIVNPRYRAFEFLNEIEHAYAAADIVVSRAGLSTITELSNLQKISIIIPMPNTHQEYNAYYLWKSQAAVVADQRELTSERLVRIIGNILLNRQAQQKLKASMKSLMPKDAAKKVASLLLKLAE